MDDLGKVLLSILVLAVVVFVFVFVAVFTNKDGVSYIKEKQKKYAGNKVALFPIEYDLTPLSEIRDILKDINQTLKQNHEKQ